MKKIICLVVLSFSLALQPGAYSQENWAGFNQKIAAKNYAGLKFKFSGAIRTEATANSFALIYFRVDKTNKKIGFFNNMQDRPVNSTGWKTYIIEGTIDADADSLQLGGIGFGNGSFYFDDFALEVQRNNSWTPVAINNNGFENSSMSEGLPAGWGHFKQNPKFTYSNASANPFKESKALLLSSSGIEEDKGVATYLSNARFIKDNYSKTEHQIAVRDGIKLYTVVYTPNDAGDGKKYPILLNRTPYSIGPYGKDKYPGYIGPNEMVREKYIFVHQDVRGRYMSEGTWTNMTPHIVNKKSKTDVDESNDTYDVIDWLIKNVPFNNGRVGQSGISYPGFYSSAGSIDAHPALKAVSPQAPIADFFWDDFHHNGVFTQGYFWNFPIFGTRPDKPVESDWYTLFEKPTADAYDFYKRNGTLKELGEKYYKDNFLWKEITEHPNYDTFWQKRNIVQHLRNLKPAYLVVGGWFDAEDLFGVLTTYKAIEKNNPHTYNILTMGPFGHGDWANETGNHKHHQLYFGDSIATFFQRNIEARFFNHFLKGSGDGKAGLPEAYMYNTGKKAYEQFDKWPPANVSKQKLYFHAKEKLSFSLPNATSFSEFVSDPNKPVPYTMDVAGSFQITPRNYMSEDQRFAASRPDVLVFETDVLTEDITLGGELMVKLHVSTTGSDADWVVKLIDVFPGNEPNTAYTDKNVTLSGYQHMVRSEIMRSRFRNSFVNPQPMVPNKITQVNFPLQDVLHTFKKGHRIMVQVQSTWFPAFDRNPQKYVPNIYKANASDFIKARHRVYQGGGTASYIEVDVVK